MSEVVEKYIYGYPWHLPDGTIRYTCRSTFTGIGSSTNPKGSINETQILDVATVVWNNGRRCSHKEMAEAITDDPDLATSQKMLTWRCSVTVSDDKGELLFSSIGPLTLIYGH